ncbi:MAG TPA: UDP-N-acetylmuramoyl-L-alanine--D-glutamate ligase [Dehalococcoidia bacterium]|nr:UDP-N-acetylmuramoyl-L-alanine--D-glutamate ligase [Dehalococcoidia bacterium]
MTAERDFLVGKRVTVIGLGIEGVDAARYAATHGAASVTVCDSQPAASLTERRRELEGLPITYQLGTLGIEAVAASDIVFASQSVPLSAPPLDEARRLGITITSMTREFLRRCPGPTIGITGSSGKTTTTSLVAAILNADGRPYRVGGNIGVGLLGLLDEMDAATWAVLEISHTQLQLTDRSPHIATVLNITPNHLDQFSWDDYVSLKRNIVRYQAPDDYVVLNLDEPMSAASAEETPARAWHFTMGGELPGNGAFLRDGAVFVRRDAVEEMVLPVDEIPLRGAHNIENVLAASAVAAAAGVGSEAIARAVRAFQPVPHRLEVVAEVDGVRYVNDSIATTPERTVAGMRSFAEPLVLLLGGKDKDLPKDELAREAIARCRAIVYFGADGPLLERAVGVAADGAEAPAQARAGTLAEAVARARGLAQPGDVVLLSPACTSFDAYRNFEERGEEFRRLVRAMAGQEDA